MEFQLTQTRLTQDLQEIAAGDPVVAAAIAQFGLPEERRAGAPSFEHLLRILVGQQLSVRAAATIFGRVQAALGETPEPARVMAATEDELRTLGLSRQKVAYARGLAEAVLEQRIDPPALAAMPDEDVIRALTALKGFGRWSAEMFLLFSLGRCDVWPVDDLGIRAGLQRLHALDERPDRERAILLGAPWSPRRSAMALFLWHLHGAP